MAFGLFLGLCLLHVVSFSRADDVCQDVINDCRSYGPNACVEYGDWAKTNCAYTCQFCTGTPPPKKCLDYISNCAEYDEEMCISSEYKTWAEDHCPLYCGFCESDETPTPGRVTGTTPHPPIPTTQATPPLCEDVISFCMVYSTLACVDTVWANTYCRKYCKRC